MVTSGTVATTPPLAPAGSSSARASRQVGSASVHHRSAVASLDEDALAHGHPGVGVAGQRREPVERHPPPGEHPGARLDVVREPQATRHRGRGVGHRLVTHAAHHVAGPGQTERRRQPHDATADHRHPCHARILP